MWNINTLSTCPIHATFASSNMKLTQRRSTYSRNSLYRTRKIWTSSRPQTIIKGGECIYRTQIYRISGYIEQTASPEASTIVVYMECRGHRWSAAIITHTRLTALCPGITRASRYQKGKTNLDFTEARDSGISWAVCKSAPCSRQITIPAPHHSVFLQAGCPYCRPTNSVKALKAPAIIIRW